MTSAELRIIVWALANSGALSRTDTQPADAAILADASLTAFDERWRLDKTRPSKPEPPENRKLREGESPSR